MCRKAMTGIRFIGRDEFGYGRAWTIENPRKQVGLVYPGHRNCFGCDAVNPFLDVFQSFRIDEVEFRDHHVFGQPELQIMDDRLTPRGGDRGGVDDTDDFGESKSAPDSMRLKGLHNRYRVGNAGCLDDHEVEFTCTLPHQFECPDEGTADRAAGTPAHDLDDSSRTFEKVTVDPFFTSLVLNHPDA